MKTTATNTFENPVLWAIVSKKTGKVRAFETTRTAARDRKRTTEKVLKFVADYSARA